MSADWRFLIYYRRLVTTLKFIRIGFMSGKRTVVSEYNDLNEFCAKAQSCTEIDSEITVLMNYITRNIINTLNFQKKKMK